MSLNCKMNSQIFLTQINNKFNNKKKKNNKNKKKKNFKKDYKEKARY